MISFCESRGGDATATAAVHIGCYQLSDPVSSLNSPPLKRSGRQAGGESSRMFGAATINTQLIEFTTLV